MPANTARFQGTLDEARVWSRRTEPGADPVDHQRRAHRPARGLRRSLGHERSDWGDGRRDSIATTANGTITGTGATRVGRGAVRYLVRYDATGGARPASPRRRVTATVGLTWTANSEPDLAGYNVYRSTTDAGRAYARRSTAATLRDVAGVHATTTRRQRHARTTTSSRPSTTRTTSRAASNRGHRHADRRRRSSPPGSTSGTSGAYVTFGDPAKLDLVDVHDRDVVQADRRRASATPPGTGGIAQLHPARRPWRPAGREARTSTPTGSSASTTPTDVLAADFEDAGDAGLNHPISGTTPIVTGNVWHHAAATYDGTTLAPLPRRSSRGDRGRGTLHASLRQHPARRARRHARLGSGTPASTARFQGVLDEARVWTGARNLSQVQAGRSPAPGLHDRARRPLVDGRGQRDAPSTTRIAAGRRRHDRRRRHDLGRPELRSTSRRSVAGPNQNVTLPSSALLDGARARRRPAVAR